ncbi:MAG: BTAD domain-containing putative transcriptional regulator [Gemmatimonadales bacterium]
MLRLITLGRLELVRSGTDFVEPIPAQTKRLALLAYLALAPAGGVRRDRLMALFWPEAGDDEGRRALRQALYYLREIVGDGALVSRPDGAIALADGGLWCDTVAFEAALGAGRGAEAMELYGGDFLEDCVVSEASAELEQWADQVRGRLRQSAAQAAWSIADQEEHAGRSIPALDAARRAHALNVDDERGTRRLIGLLDRLGDRTGALHAYQELTDRLAREFGAEPSPESRALGEALRSPQSPVVGPALVGHEVPSPAGGRAPSPTALRWLVGVSAALTLAALGYVGVRVLRQPQERTLLEAGRMTAHDRVLVSEFRNHTRDSLLAGAITEALRADLAQSPVVKLLSAQQVQSALARMERSSAEPLSDSVVREIAVREGAKAFVTGDVASLGSRYTIAAELISAESGEILVGLRETAADSNQLLMALEKLSVEMRGRIGESLQSIRASQPLDRVTTRSLQALRLYSQSTRALHYHADRARGRALLEEAVALDTGFAAAYTRLAIEYSVIGEFGRASDMQARAFRHRDRLGNRERAFTSAIYYTSLTQYDRAVAAYQALLDIDPADVKALNNLGFIYAELRDFPRAEQYYARAVRADSSIVVVWNGLQQTLINQGKYTEARRAIDRAHIQFPGNLHLGYTEIYLAAALGDYRTAERHARVMIAGSAEDPIRRADGLRTLADLSLLRGRLHASSRYRREAMLEAEQGGYRASALLDALAGSAMNVWVRGTPEKAPTLIELLARHPLDSVPPLDRPYVEIASAYAARGLQPEVRALAADFERAGTPSGRFRRAAQHHILGVAALGEGRYALAESELRQAAETEQCVICSLPELARAYDLGGQRDSAIAVYQRYLSTPWIGRLELDGVHLVAICERLATLYEERNERQRAAELYRRVVALWRDADPELRPRVIRAERRLAALSVER